MSEHLPDFLYDSVYPIRSLGEAYRPEARFEHGTDVVVARIDKSPPDGDGQAVIVRECRLPAMFYSLEALSGQNSVGVNKHGYKITTGSGLDMGELIGRLAIEISRGMIGVDSDARAQRDELLAALKAMTRALKGHGWEQLGENSFERATLEEAHAAIAKIEASR